MLVVTSLQIQGTAIVPTYANVSVVGGQLVVENLGTYQLDDLTNNDLTSLVNTIANGGGGLPAPWTATVSGTTLNFNYSGTSVATISQTGAQENSGGYFGTQGYFRSSVSQPVCDANGYLYTSTLTPTGSSYSGVVGQIAFDSNYFYICVNTNSWKRAALSSF